MWFKLLNLCQVKIEKRNQLPTILLNDRYLLTVTEQNAVPGSPLDEQATIWVQQIQEALQQACLERTTSFLLTSIFRQLPKLNQTH